LPRGLNDKLRFEPLIMTRFSLLPLACACALGIAPACDDAASGAGRTSSASSSSSASAASTASAAASATADVDSEATPVAPDAVADLVLGGDHSFVLYGDGTVKAWGDNSDSALGFGKKKQRQVRPKRVPLLKYVRQIDTGEHHSCAAYADGLARCWGRNFGGALGDGTSRDNSLPTAVAEIRGVLEVRVAGKHSCARLAKGDVRCWGRVVKGSNRKPVDVPGLSKVTGLSLGVDRACAWHGDGKASCWGLAIGLKYDPKDAKDGGDGNLKASAQSVPKLADLDRMVLSRTHACVLHRDATVSCWGFGSRGQLGDGKHGANHHLLEPTKVAGLDKVAQVAVGDGFSCARLTDGTVRCWGDNVWGQLGLGDKRRRLEPTAVPGLENVRMVAAGTGHVCALGKDDALWCWGKNLDGQLGNGMAGIQASMKKPTAVDHRK
jgi:alpha-tubulin suppressor-like RCC1 family protein